MSHLVAVSPQLRSAFKPQPVSLLIMPALWNTAVRRAPSNSTRAGKPVNVRRSND